MILRIYLVHSQRYCREAMKRAFAKDSSFHLIGFSRDAAQAIKRRSTQSADLVLFEIDQSPKWVESLQRFCFNLREHAPETPVVALGAKSDQDVVRAITVGAYGAVAAEASSVKLRRILQQLHARRPVASASLTHAIVREIHHLAKREEQRPKVKLTSRQKEVLSLMHLEDEAISRHLGIQKSTVKAHVHAVLIALGARDRQHALVLHRHRIEEAAT